MEYIFVDEVMKQDRSVFHLIDANSAYGIPTAVVRVLFLETLSSSEFCVLKFHFMFLEIHSNQYSILLKNNV